MDNKELLNNENTMEQNGKLSREDKTLSSIMKAINLEPVTVSPAKKRKQKIIKFISNKFVNIAVWLIMGTILAILVTHLIESFI